MAGYEMDSVPPGVDRHYYNKVLVIFRKLDLNGDGTVDRRELGDVLKVCDSEYWSDERLDGLLVSMNNAADGLIHFGEMLTWLMDKPAHKLWKLFDGVEGPREAYALNGSSIDGDVPSLSTLRARQTEKRSESEKVDLYAQMQSTFNQVRPVQENRAKLIADMSLAELRWRSAEKNAGLDRTASAEKNRPAEMDRTALSEQLAGVFDRTPPNEVPAVSELRIRYDGKFEDMLRMTLRLEAENKEVHLMLKSAIQAIDLLGSRCSRLEGEMREVRGGGAPPIPQSNPEFGSLLRPVHNFDSSCQSSTSALPLSMSAGNAATQAWASAVSDFRQEQSSADIVATVDAMKQDLIRTFPETFPDNGAKEELFKTFPTKKSSGRADSLPPRRVILGTQAMNSPRQTVSRPVGSSLQVEPLRSGSSIQVSPLRGRPETSFRGTQGLVVQPPASSVRLASGMQTPIRTVMVGQQLSSVPPPQLSSVSATSAPPGMSLAMVPSASASSLGGRPVGSLASNALLQARQSNPQGTAPRALTPLGGSLRGPSTPVIWPGALATVGSVSTDPGGARRPQEFPRFEFKS